MHENKANGSAKNRPKDSHSNTEAKQRSLANLKPFKKGDERINRNGRPKSFDQCRELAQQIAHALEESGLTTVEAILGAWAHGKDIQAQKAFIEYAFGKVPDKIESTIDDKRSLRLHWPHERQDLATSQNGSTNRDN